MNWVNNWIGAPYQANGRGPSYDCYGLVKAIYKEQLNIDMPDWLLNLDTFKSQAEAFKTGINESIEQDCVIEVLEPQNFDLVMVYRHVYCGHIGIYLNGHVLHIGSKTSGARYELLSTFKKTNGKVKYLQWLK